MPRAKGPGDPLQPSEIQRLLVLVEHLQTDIQRVADGHTTLERQIAQFRQELSTRIDGLGNQMSFGFREAFQRLDRVEQRLDRVEQRLDRVEQRLDRVEQRLDGLKQDLDQVKQTVLENAKRLEAHEQIHTR